MYGVAKVNDSKSSALAAGDWCLPYPSANMNTWTDSVKCKGDMVMKIDSEKVKSPEYAANIVPNGVCALRLLSDFETLGRGDWIVVNDALNPVAQSILQLCKLKGIEVIAVMTEAGSQYSEKHDLLSALGATVCFPKTFIETEGKYVKDTLFNTMGKGIKLVLNNEGGEGAWLKDYVPSSTKFVTYGGTGSCGESFCFEDWATTSSPEVMKDSVETIADYIASDDLTFYVEKFGFEDYKFAMQKANMPSKHREVILSVSSLPSDAEKEYSSAEIADLKSKFEQIVSKLV